MNEKIQAFLRESGFAPTHADRVAVMRAFEGEADAAITGAPSSLRMIDSCLSFSSVVPATSAPVVVVDAGGTNLRVAAGIPCRNRGGGGRRMRLGAGCRGHRLLLFLRVPFPAGRRRGTRCLVEAGLGTGGDRTARGRRARPTAGGRPASGRGPERHGGDAPRRPFAPGRGMPGTDRLHPRHGHERGLR